MHKTASTVVVVAIVACLVVAAGARSAALGGLQQPQPDTQPQPQPQPQPALSRNKRAYYFRGFRSCPIGYIRSPAFKCIKCEMYTKFTGLNCKN